MDLAAPPALADQDRALAGAFGREAKRLRGFIRRRVADAFDAEDILQDVFSELVEATRVATPIEHVGAWLFRVATNRITDRFRRKSFVSLDAPSPSTDAPDDDFEPMLPASASRGPEGRCADRAFLDALEAALAELPPAQREVFVAHELEGRSFRSLADESGVAVNTLLARKRHAVIHLRQRLAPHHLEST